MKRTVEAAKLVDMHRADGTGLAFEEWIDRRQVEMHGHAFYELLLIARGALRHVFRGNETILIPGDAVLVPPHEAHGFLLGGESRIFNCQFKADAIDAEIAADVLESLTDDSVPIRLHPEEYVFVTSLLASALLTMGCDERRAHIRKKKYMELILLELADAKAREEEIRLSRRGGQRRAIAEVLQYIDDHLDETLAFDEMAARHGFSANHFRKLFKDATGLSPVKYHNRLRIIRACAYMQKEGLAAAEAAARVGIYDMNYFSRVFRQVMGVTPSKL